MKKFKILMLLLILSTAVNNLLAQDNYALSGHTATISGTSNLHSWHENIEKISGKGEAKQNADKSVSLQTLSIVIQVNSIKSDESAMNSKTYKALKADKFPEITFALTEALVNIPHGANGYSATVKGHLTIAGATKPVVMPVKISLGEDKKITVEGVQQVKMTDYGIDPPTALLGMLKTGDVVTIDFKTSFSSAN